MSSTIAPNISGTAKFVLGQGASTVGTAQGYRISLNSVGLINHLKINTGSIGVTLQTNVTVKGTLELTSSGTLSLGAFALKYGAGGTLEYNGSAAQITSDFEFPTADAPTNLTINNTNGVTLHAARTIPGTLILTSGKLTLGSNNLTLGSTATISGASASNYIIADGNGELRKQITDSPTLPFSFTFPVGDNTGTAEYSPVTLSFTSGTFSSAYAGVKLSNTKHPSNTSTVDYINRFWTVTQSGISGFSCDAYFTYSDADIAGTETNIYCGKYDSPIWTLFPVTNAASNTLTAGGVTSFSDFTGGELGSVPVELTSFKAKINGSSVVLNWSTVSETNNSGFEIEKSFNNQSFEKVGFVQGAGTTTEGKDYSFTDTKVVTGQYSYRLKQIDLDGTFSYSNIVVVSINAPDKFELAQNYPNPFNPETKIRFEIPMTSFVNVSVFNVLGEKVATLVNESLEQGIYEKGFAAINLTSGIYIYKLTAGAYSITKKMMLTK